MIKIAHNLQNLIINKLSEDRSPGYVGVPKSTGWDGYGVYEREGQPRRYLRLTPPAAAPTPPAAAPTPPAAAPTPPAAAPTPPVDTRQSYGGPAVYGAGALFGYPLDIGNRMRALINSAGDAAIHGSRLGKLVRALPAMSAAGITPVMPGPATPPVRMPTPPGPATPPVRMPVMPGPATPPVRMPVMPGPATPPVRMPTLRRPNLSGSLWHNPSVY